MAEGLTAHLKSDLIEPYSAGIEPKGVDPRAAKAMKEIDIDISIQKSKHVNEFKEITFDYVITVCGHANENCPVFLGKTKILHFGFEDPPKLAENASNDEDALSHYRRVRDEIKDFVLQLPEILSQNDSIIK